MLTLTKYAFLILALVLAILALNFGRSKIILTGSQNVSLAFYRYTIAESDITAEYPSNVLARITPTSAETTLMQNTGLIMQYKIDYTAANLADVGWTAYDSNNQPAILDDCTISCRYYGAAQTSGGVAFTGPETTKEIKLPKIKTLDGTTLILTETGSNSTDGPYSFAKAGDYYGQVVDYSDGNTALTYRLFYVDFDDEDASGKFDGKGKYGDTVGTMYLMADYDESLTRKLSDFTSQYTSSSDTKVEEMNPLWAVQRAKTETTTPTWNENEKAAAYLCDTTKWTTYLNQNKANYAIGGASTEMFIDSYTQWGKGNNTLGYAYQTTNTPGYVYKVNGTMQNDGFWTNTDTLNSSSYGTDAGANKMYVNNHFNYWWLASPSTYYSYAVCAVRGGNRYLGSDSGNTVGVRPLVSLKQGTIPQITNYVEFQGTNTKTPVRYYATLAQATAGATSGNTIAVLNDTTETTAATLAAGKTATLDLNGKIITLNNVSLTNNGTLNITGTSGELTASAVDTITNTGTLTKSGDSKISNSAAATYYAIRNSGTATLSAGTINGNFGVIENNAAGKLLVSGASIEGTRYGIINTGTSANENSPSVKIESGTVKTETSNAISNDGEGTIVIEGGTVCSETTSGPPTILNYSTGKIVINGGTINSGNTSLSQTGNGSQTEIRGATITGKTGVVISNGSLIITGGTITATTVGAYCTGGILTIGNNSDTVSTSTPSITGATYGVQIGGAGTFNFYDGIIKAPTGNTPISGTVSATPTGYSVKYGTTTENGTTYDTAYLANTYTLTRVTNNNLVTNGTFEDTQLVKQQYTANGVTHTWDGNLNGVPGNTDYAYSAKGWGSGVNWGVDVPEIGYHAHIKTVNNNKVFDFKTNEDYAGQTPANVPGGVSLHSGQVTVWRWLGISQAITGTKFTAGKKYKITMDVYRVSGNGYITSALYYSTNANTTRHFENNEERTQRFIPTTTGSWETLSYTFTLSPDYLSTTNPSLFIYGHQSGVACEFYVDNVRLEEVLETTKTYGDSYTSAEMAAPAGGGIFGGWYSDANYTTKLSTTNTFGTNTATFPGGKIGTNANIYAKWLKATFDTGTAVNQKMKQLAGNSSATYNSEDTAITAFAYSSTIDNRYKTDAYKVSASTSDLPIYMWFDNGTIYWWSEDTNPYLNQLSGQMFYFCSNLTTADVSKFNTSKVTTMVWMFCRCPSLTSLNLSNFDTSNVTDMYSMFYNCRSLTNLDVSSFSTSRLTKMREMFNLCSNLSSLNLSNFDTSNVKSMYQLFNGCSSLTSLGISSFDTRNVEDMSYMFNGCGNLSSIDVSKFNTANTKYMTYMFGSCIKLTSLDVSSFNTNKVEDMSYMFRVCMNLTRLDLSNFNTSKVTTMREMFYNCSVLTDLNLSSFDTSNVNSMRSMFNQCPAITELDLTNFDTGKVTEIDGMFRACTKLKTIYVGNKWTMKAVLTSNDMFFASTLLVGGAETTYSSSNVTATYAHIDGGTSNPGYFSAKYVTSGALTLLEAINNNGGSHSSTATTWRALAGANGTVYNTGNEPSWGANYFNADGSTSYVNLGTLQSNQKTMEVTFCADTVPATAFHIISDWSGSNGGCIQANTSGLLQGAYCINGELKYARSNTIIQPGTIYHVALTYDGTNVKIYVNGELRATTPASGNIGTGNNMFLGRAGTGAQFFDGKIYTAAVYNRALTPEEIQQNAIAGLAIAESSSN